MDQDTGGKMLIHDAKRRKNNQLQYPSWVSRCVIKGSDGTMLNPIFWKKGQGQKHTGRWETVERKIPSVKMLFKTDTNGQKHPRIINRTLTYDQTVTSERQYI